MPPGPIELHPDNLFAGNTFSDKHVGRPPSKNAQIFKGEFRTNELIS